jgi:peptidyl-prolyl cis-trans isomerase B (cyclophilin B)
MIKLNTNHGSISIELDHAKAPDTSANFLQYAKDGFYEGTLFHRVIPKFMIQGGGMEPGMKQKTTRASIQNEAANGLSNATGTVAMARTSDPHSASSQFFINVADNTFLDHKAPRGDAWGYCVFGRVVQGMDVVNAILAVKTTSTMGHQDVPAEDVVIESVEIIDE